MSPRQTVARTFVSLQRHRNYRLWFAGQMTSLSGTWVQNTAFAWYVIATTNSGFATGALIACQFAPYLLLGLLGGSVADRIENRKLILVTQSTYVVVAAVVTVVSFTGHLSVPFVFAAASVNGLIQAFDTPARQAFTMQMVGREELPNAVALNTSLFNASRALGPGIGGVLIATVGLSACFLINALSFLAVVTALWLMRPAELFRPKAQSGKTSRSMRAGFTYAWGQPDLRMVLVLILIVATLAMNFQTVLPVLAKKTIFAGPGTFGFLMASFGVGAIIGGLVSATVARPNWRLLLASGAFFSLTLVALAPVRTVAPAAGILLLCGVGFALYATTSNATVQLNTPDHLRGRIMGLYGYFFIGTTPIGALFEGWLSDHSTALAFGVTGGVSVIAIAVAAVIRVRRQPGSNPTATPKLSPQMS